MYIPFYTKYRTLQEDLKREKEKNENLNLINKDLMDEHYEDSMRRNKYENMIIEIVDEIKRPQFNSSKNLGNKLLTIIDRNKKELDVR